MAEFVSTSCVTDSLDDLVQLLPLLHDWQEARRRGGELVRNAFVIEFGGMPKAGKSSAIENIRHFFTHGPKLLESAGGLRRDDYRKLGYEVHTPAEGVSLRTPNYLKRSPLDFNTWAGAYSVQELLQAAHDDHHDLVVLDRGPWDAGCWLEYWASHGPSNVSDVRDFFQLDYWMTRSDLHVVLIVDPSVAAGREQDHRLIRHKGASSNVDLMKKMHEIYSERFIELKAKKGENCPHVGDKAAILIDTTKASQVEVARQIIQAAFSILEAKIGHDSHEFHFEQEFVLAQLAGYMQRVLPKTKVAVTGFLPEFVERANALTPQQKYWLRQELCERAFPAERAQLVEQRVTADSITNSLNGLLSEAQGR